MIAANENGSGARTGDSEIENEEMEENENGQK